MKSLAYFILILLFSSHSFAQGHFVLAFSGNGQDHMNILIASATIGVENLQSGDEIATFDGSVCCGKIILTKPITDSNSFIILSASRNDAVGTEPQNGYKVGNTISYKFWDSRKNLEISGISAEYPDPVTGLPITAPTYAPLETAIVKLSVAAASNQTPTANAGLNQLVNEGASVTLDGSASSDADSNPLTYSWTAPAGITLSSATVAQPTFTAPEVNTDTDYTFSLIVNDGTINSAADLVTITVKQVNKVPMANAGAGQSVNEGVVVTLDGTASTDSDPADVLTYLWTAPSGISLSSTRVSQPTFTAPEVTINTDYSFTLVVNDGKGNSTADQVIIQVKQVNKVPVANAGTDREVTEKQVFHLDGSLSFDFDNAILIYKWTAPAGITLNSATVAKPSFIAPDVAANTNYTFSLIVNDGIVDSPADQVVITVIPNKAPVANAGPNQTVAQKQNVSLNGSASSDPENDPFTYHWMVPFGFTLINPNTANPSFEAPLVATDTDFSIKLKVNDGELDSPEDEVIIRVLQNHLPVANAGPDFSTDEGSNLSLNGSASTDPEGNTLTYKWTAPSEITLSSATAASPTFTAPEVAANTNFTFSLIVNDGTNDSQPDQVIVTISQVNKAPTANAGSDQSINEELLVTLDGTMSSDPDNDALAYTWTAPAGVILSSTSASKPTFTAPNVTINTDYSFKLTVTDGLIISTADFVVITVKKVNQQPLANAGTDQTANEGTIITLDGSGSSDPDSDALTYLWIVPSGVTLSSATLAKPTFTAPEVQADKEFKFTLTVNDGALNSFTDEVTVMIKQVNKAPTAYAGPDQTVNEMTLVTLDGLASADSDNDALVYTWTAPADISLSSTTASKPTFTVPEVAADTKFTISLVVNDGTVNSPPDQVVITVNNVDKAPFVKDSIKNISVYKRAPNQITDLKTIFADDDIVDVMSYVVTSNTNKEVVSALIDGSSLTLRFSTENTGLSEIEITASTNGKEAKSKFKVEVKIPTSSDPIFIDQKMTVYPNPTSGKIMVVFDQILQKGTYMTVNDVWGRIILKQFIQNKEEGIDLKGNPPGLYLIKTNLNNMKVQKVILK